MNKKILYAGDTSLTTAASYLAGILTHAKLPFDYVASDQPIAPALGGAEHALYIISDYPVNNMTDADFEAICSNVEAGAGLIMLGGWESYHGANGEYNQSPLAKVLPVEISDSDDRVNSPQPCLIETLCQHPILGDLPFDAPPGIGGYNRYAPKADATQILSARHFDVKRTEEGDYSFNAQDAAPLLVVGSYGKGRTAALATDVAPHWVGGFVDWGPERVVSQGPGAEQVEVGNLYAEFFTRLVKWTMGTLD